LGLPEHVTFGLISTIFNEARYFFIGVHAIQILHLIELTDFDEELAFEIRKQAWLYRDAKFMIQKGKGNKEKLEAYMERRIEKIESTLNISRPFRIVDKGEAITEVPE
jgi:hypothetical protein